MKITNPIYKLMCYDAENRVIFDLVNVRTYHSWRRLYTRKWNSLNTFSNEVAALQVAIIASYYWQICSVISR